MGSNPTGPSTLLPYLCRPAKVADFWTPGYVIRSPNETDEELYDYLPELVTRDDILAPHSESVIGGRRAYR